jgi:hypothetical protein
MGVQCFIYQEIYEKRNSESSQNNKKMNRKRLEKQRERRTGLQLQDIKSR